MDFLGSEFEAGTIRNLRSQKSSSESSKLILTGLNIFLRIIPKRSTKFVLQKDFFCLVALVSLDRGWYLGRAVGSRFCSCKVALPNPNHYIFHAQAKKITTKVQPQPG